MFARTVTVRGDPRLVEDGIAYCSDAVWPFLRHMDGCVGMSMLADRTEGRCIVTSAWATEEDLRSSEGKLQGKRSRTAEVVRADEAEVAEWEIAVMHRRHPTGDGAAVRVLWAEVARGRMDGGVQAFRTSLLPRMEDLPGFCSVSLLIDRTSDQATASVVYETREALVGSRALGADLREEFAAPMGARITEVAEFDLVIAHLRVPELT